MKNLLRMGMIVLMGGILAGCMSVDQEAAQMEARGVPRWRALQLAQTDHDRRHQQMLNGLQAGFAGMSATGDAIQAQHWPVYNQNQTHYSVMSMGGGNYSVTSY